MFELYSESYEKTYPIDKDESTKFDSFLEAKEFASDLVITDFKPRKVRVTRTWQDREQTRLIDGTYKTVPFAERDAWLRIVAANPNHFVHVSRKKIARLAYTESTKKGEGDVQTPIAFADYMLKFGGAATGEEKAELASIWRASDASAELNFARTDDEIVAFMTRKDIPESCMSGWRSRRVQFHAVNHPYRVYGEGSDLTVAYIERADGVCIARALVWEAEKIIGRLYGDETALASALRELRFSKGSFKGARIKRLPKDGGYVMPYLDNPCQWVRDRGDHFTLDADGDFECASQDGYIEDSADRYVCERCGEPCDETYDVYISRRASQSWCASCRGDAFHCDGYGNLYSDDVGCLSIGRHAYSIYYIGDNFNLCERTNEYVRDDLKTVILDRHGNTAEWCDDAVNDYAFTCRVDGKLYADDMLSPHMQDGEDPIAVVSDERDFYFHAIPAQLTLSV